MSFSSSDDDSDAAPEHFFQTSLFWEKLNGALCTNPLLLRVYPCLCGRAECGSFYPADYAILYENFATLRWLVSQGAEWTSVGFDWAVDNTNLDMAHWLYERGAVFTGHAIYRAVITNNIAALEFLFERRDEVLERWKEVTNEDPLQPGELDMDPDFVYEAAHADAVHSLQWMYDHEWPWVSDLLMYSFPSVSVISWIHHTFSDTFPSYLDLPYVKRHTEPIDIDMAWETERILDENRYCRCGRSIRRTFLLRMLAVPWYFDFSALQ